MVGPQHDVPTATTAYVIGLGNGVTSAVMEIGDSLVMVEGPFTKSAVASVAGKLGVL